MDKNDRRHNDEDRDDRKQVPNPSSISTLAAPANIKKAPPPPPAAAVAEAAAAIRPAEATKKSIPLKKKLKHRIHRAPESPPSSNSSSRSRSSSNNSPDSQQGIKKEASMAKVATSKKKLPFTKKPDVVAASTGGAAASAAGKATSTSQTATAATMKKKARKTKVAAAVAASASPSKAKAKIKIKRKTGAAKASTSSSGGEDGGSGDAVAAAAAGGSAGAGKTAVVTKQKRKSNIWTEKEKAAYHKAFAKYGMRWEKLAKVVPNRSTESLRHYYHRVYKKEHPEIVSTKSEKIRKRPPKWTDDEEALFHEAFQQYGTQWEKLAMVFPNRTISALKTYYQREYKKEHTEEISQNEHVCQKRPWTQDEEDDFHKGYLLHGTQWDMYSSILPKRTATALELYYHRVYKYEHPNGIRINEGLAKSKRQRANKAKAKRAEKALKEQDAGKIAAASGEKKKSAKRKAPRQTQPPKKPQVEEDTYSEDEGVSETEPHGEDHTRASKKAKSGPGSESSPVSVSAGSPRGRDTATASQGEEEGIEAEVPSKTPSHRHLQQFGVIPPAQISAHSSGLELPPSAAAYAAAQAQAQAAFRATNVLNMEGMLRDEFNQAQAMSSAYGRLFSNGVSAARAYAAASLGGAGSVNGIPRAFLNPSGLHIPGTVGSSSLPPIFPPALSPELSGAFPPLRHNESGGGVNALYQQFPDVAASSAAVMYERRYAAAAASLANDPRLASDPAALYRRPQDPNTSDLLRFYLSR